MSNRLIATLFGAILLVASSFWAGIGTFAPQLLTSNFASDSESTSGRFPSKLMQEVFLPNNDGKRIAYIRYEVVNGVRTKVSGVVFYDQEHEGFIDYLTFDKRGYIVKSEKYFPLVDKEEEAGILRRLAVYEASGTLFKKHIVHRKDASIERSGERLRDGRYHIRYFFEDGVTLQRERFFTRNLVLSFERVYRNDKDHTTVSETRLLGNDVDKEYSKTVFSQTGIKIARLTKGGPMVGTKGDVFDSTGQKVVASYERTPWTTVELFFRDDGSQTQARLNYMNSVTSMFFGGEGNRMQYRQIWRTRPAANGEPQRFTLTRVTEFDTRGNELRTIEMVNDGSRPDYISSPLSKTSRSFKFVDKNGLVIKIQIKEGNTVTSEVEGSNLSPETIVFDSHIFRRENPVEFAIFDFHEPGAPAWIYDYEDNQNPLMKP